MEIPFVLTEYSLIGDEFWRIQVLKREIVEIALNKFDPEDFYMINLCSQWFALHRQMTMGQLLLITQRGELVNILNN